MHALRVHTVTSADALFLCIIYADLMYFDRNQRGVRHIVMRSLGRKSSFLAGSSARKKVRSWSADC